VSFADRRTTLELTFDEAYKCKGTTEDVATHGRDSRTACDVPDILEEMSESPEAYVVRSVVKGETIAEGAVSWLD
jgi:hypothetical protein